MSLRWKLLIWKENISYKLSEPIVNKVLLQQQEGQICIYFSFQIVHGIHPNKNYPFLIFFYSVSIQQNHTLAPFYLTKAFQSVRIKYFPFLLYGSHQIVISDETPRGVPSRFSKVHFIPFITLTLILNLDSPFYSPLLTLSLDNNLIQ